MWSNSAVQLAVTRLSDDLLKVVVAVRGAIVAGDVIIS